IAFVEKSIFANQVSLGKPLFEISKLQRHLLVDVAAVTVVVDARLIDQYRFFDRRDCVERFVLNLDQIHGIEGDVFIDSCHGRDGIADETYFVDAKSVFVLTNREDAIWNRQILTRDNSKNAGQCERFGNVDVLDQGVWQMATQHLTKQHSGQHDVVRKLRLTHALRAGINLAKRFANDVEI